MDRIGLHQVGMAGDAFQKEGNPGQMVLLGQAQIDLFERPNVVGAIIAREGHSSQQYLDSSLLKTLDHLNEVRAGGRNREPAESVIAAEFQDHYGRFRRENIRQTLQSVSCSISADPHVDDVVFVAGGVDQALEVVRIALTGFDTETCCQTIAERHDDRARIGRRICVRCRFSRDARRSWLRLLRSAACPERKA